MNPTISEADILRQAADWLGNQQLDAAGLRQLAQQRGLDFATAVLYQSLRQSPRHGPLIADLDETLTPNPSPEREEGSWPPVEIVIVPGAFYKEKSDTGADGRIIKESARRLGIATVTVPLFSFGTVADNATLLADFLGQRTSRPIVLVSHSKGTTEIRHLLARPDAADFFRHVQAWIDLSGLFLGTPLIGWLREHRVNWWLVRLLFWWKGFALLGLNEIDRAACPPWPGALDTAPHLNVIHVIGFPLERHLTLPIVRRGYRRLSPLGPNDGTVLLEDVFALPGRIYPVWGADHYLRPAGRDMGQLVAGILGWLEAGVRPASSAAGRLEACPTQCGAGFQPAISAAGRLEACPTQSEGVRMRIQLLSPAGEIHRHATGIFKTALRYAPLTLTTLAAMVPEDLNAQITIQDEGVQPLDLDFPPSLVGITAITGTALRAYDVADILRARGHTVVIGGVHATLMPEEAAQHADAIVTSYAEKSWPQLVRDYAAGALQKHYFMPTGKKLEGVPIARRDLLQKKKYATVNSIEATRGCPHQCDFCAVPAAWANIYAHRPIEEVIAELRSFEGRHALFIDLSPVEDVHYAKALYRAMIPLRIRWVGLATTRVAEDAELLDLAAKSGCRGLLIGFESISQSTLEETRKGFHKASDYRTIVKRLHDHGIGIQGCFVFGFDNDDESVFERTVEFVDRVKIDLPRYAVMTPFPGTGYFRRMEAQGRLLHQHWPLYDVEHVVFQPKRMSPERLQEGLEWSWRQSYRWRSIFNRVFGSRCVLPLSISLNLGYRYYAHHLYDKTGPTVYRDTAYLVRGAGFQPAGDIGGAGFQPAEEIGGAGFQPAGDIGGAGFQPAADALTSHGRLEACPTGRR